MNETALGDCEELLSKLDVSHTHQPAGPVVVKIHQGSGILPFLQTVHKESGDLFPEFHIVAAASPDPAMATYTQGKKFCIHLSAKSQGKSHVLYRQELNHPQEL